LRIKNQLLDCNRAACDSSQSTAGVQAASRNPPDFMTLKVLNIADLERELRNRAAHLYSPEAQEWLKTVPKNHLLNVDGRLDETDKQENFAQYHREWERHELDGVPEVLPDLRGYDMSTLPR
jgi:hypothetical protein